MTSIRMARTLCGGLAAAMILALSGCSGSSTADSVATPNGAGNSSTGNSGNSSSSSTATILGVETPSAISVVTATNAT